MALQISFEAHPTPRVSPADPNQSSLLRLADVPKFVHPYEPTARDESEKGEMTGAFERSVRLFAEKESRTTYAIRASYLL
jgi:hypothetical protein